MAEMGVRGTMASKHSCPALTKSSMNSVVRFVPSSSEFGSAM